MGVWPGAQQALGAGGEAEVDDRSWAPAGGADRPQHPLERHTFEIAHAWTFTGAGDGINREAAQAKSPRMPKSILRSIGAPLIASAFGSIVESRVCAPCMVYRVANVIMHSCPWTLAESARSTDLRTRTRRCAGTPRRAQPRSRWSRPSGSRRTWSTTGASIFDSALWKRGLGSGRGAAGALAEAMPLTVAAGRPKPSLFGGAADPATGRGRWSAGACCPMRLPYRLAEMALWQADGKKRLA